MFLPNGPSYNYHERISVTNSACPASHFIMDIDDGERGKTNIRNQRLRYNLGERMTLFNRSNFSFMAKVRESQH